MIKALVVDRNFDLISGAWAGKVVARCSTERVTYSSVNANSKYNASVEADYLDEY